jgi:fermentation-respiration switch protein FrsA (DUF1100 family)
MFLVAQGCVLAWPSQAHVGAAPKGLDAQEVAFASLSGATIHAWLIPGKTGAGAVLLLHGTGEDRRSMLGRARFLHDAGFTILAPDFQATGESRGSHVTFGALESLDALAALGYLRDHARDERVGVIGVSMGGAASLLGAQPLAADALVLESVYPTLREAVEDRLHVWLGPIGFLSGAVAPALLNIVGPQIGVDDDRMRPIDVIERVVEPLLMIAGTLDRYTPLREARALYARARAPKELWEVQGARHEDMYAFAPAAYEQKVGSFLSLHLRSASY